MADSAHREYLSDVPARRLGAALARHRTDRGATLEDIARRLENAFSAAILEMIEAGMYPLAEPQIHLLLDGYQVTGVDLLPARHKLEFDDDGQYMAVEWTVRELGDVCTPEALLEEYLAFVYELRGMQPGAAIPLRDDDLAVLSNTIDWPTDLIRNHLIDLMFRWRQTLPPAHLIRPAESADQNGPLSLLQRLRAGEATPRPDGGVRDTVRSPDSHSR